MKIMESRALWHRNNVISEIIRQPEIEDLQRIKINSKYSLVSSGTEILIARGLVPSSLYMEMVVPYMKGEFTFPIKYGYSLVGEIDAKDKSYHQKPVHLLHPHQDICLVHHEDCFEIDCDIPAKRATLASNMETIVTAIWDSEVSIGDRVLITGFGLIGSLLARILSMMPGIEVYILEIAEKRKQYVKNMNFALLESPDEVNQPFDIAFNTSHHESGLQHCIDLTGTEGKIIELSWYGNKDVSIQLGGSFHSMRKKILSSQVSALPLNRLGRWDFKRRKKLVFELLRNPSFDDHLTHEISLDEAAELFNQWRHENPEGLGYCINYSL
jgi:hypothetical protein